MFERTFKKGGIDAGLDMFLVVALQTVNAGEPLVANYDYTERLTGDVRAIILQEVNEAMRPRAVYGGPS